MESRTIQCSGRMGAVAAPSSPAIATALRFQGSVTQRRTRADPSHLPRREGKCTFDHLLRGRRPRAHDGGKSRVTCYLGGTESMHLHFCPECGKPLKRGADGFVPACPDCDQTGVIGGLPFFLGCLAAVLLSALSLGLHNALGLVIVILFPIGCVQSTRQAIARLRKRRR
jgi:hypothetical protein